MANKMETCSTKEVENILLTHYGIKVDSLKENAMGGTSFCYKIKAQNIEYFFKKSKVARKHENILKEIELLEFLAGTDVPVPKFIRTLNNKSYIEENDSYIYLQEFISGKCYKLRNLPYSLFFQSAEILARLNKCLTNYDLAIPKYLEPEKIIVYKPTGTIKRIKMKLVELEKSPISSRKIKKIKKKAKIIIKLLKDTAEYSKYFEGITYLPTHTDYHCQNLIFNRKKIAAVLDFYSAFRFPIIIDLMKFYSLSALNFSYGFHVNKRRLKEFIKCYNKYSKLNENDLRYAVEVYVHYIIRRLITPAFNKYIEAILIDDKTQACKYIKRVNKYLKHAKYFIKNKETISKELMSIKMP